MDFSLPHKLSVCLLVYCFFVLFFYLRCSCLMKSGSGCLQPTNKSKNVCFKLKRLFFPLMKEGSKYLLKQLLSSGLEKVIYELISIFIECAVLLNQQVCFP